MEDQLYVSIHVRRDIRQNSTLSANIIKFICTRFRNRKIRESLASCSVLFRNEWKLVLYFHTMYVYCIYPAMEKKVPSIIAKLSKRVEISGVLIVFDGVLSEVRVHTVNVSYSRWEY